MLAAGCGEDPNAEAARSLLQRVRADGYRSWARAPDYEVRRKSHSPHSDFVDIYLNDRIAEQLASGEPSDTWRVGSIIAKDGFSGSGLELIALMEKRDDGWYWAEYDTEGNASYAGHPPECTNCHRSGDDYVRAFSLPASSD
jgi:hypothetical protein